MEKIQALIDCLFQIKAILMEWFRQQRRCPHCATPEEQPMLCFSEQNAEDLMDAQEVMDYLRISRSTFFRLKKEGLLQPSRIRGRDYFSRSELATVLELSIRKGKM